MAQLPVELNGTTDSGTSPKSPGAWFSGRIPAGPARSAVIWILTAVGSATIGLVIKSWWDAPKPHIELSTVQLRSFGDPSARITIPTELRERMVRHAYLDDPGAAVSVKDIEDRITTAESADGDHRQLEAHIDKLIELLQNRTTTIDVGDRRREFLGAWAASQGERLNGWVKGALFARETTLPARYRVHRTGDYTRDIDLGNGMSMNLSEINEEEYARSESSVRGAVNVYDRVLRDSHESNLLRRMWDFMEPGVIIAVLQATKTLVDTQLQDSKRIVDQLNLLVHTAQPERLVATLVVANRGGQPLAVRNLGVLWLKVPRQDGGAEEIIPVDLTSDSSRTGAQLVAENKTLQGSDASSAGGVDLESSRLKLLFNGGGIAAAAALARAGSEATRAFVGMTEFRPVGAKGDDMILTALKNHGAS